MEADETPQTPRPDALGVYLASRMLPAFGLGVMGTFLVCRWGWALSTPTQRAVFALGALAVVAGLVLDRYSARAGDDA